MEAREVSAWFTLWHMGRWYGQQVVEFFGILVVAVAIEMRRRFHAREREAAQLQAQASQLQAERAELRARTAQLQAQSAELQAQLAEARLTVLRARLNPHFLFNTLNAVSALVAKDPRGVRDMIALLSELLRHALAESKEQEIPLRDELRLLRLYLEILEIRYQGQLQHRRHGGRRRAGRARAEPDPAAARRERDEARHRPGGRPRHDRGACVARSATTSC